MAINDTPHCEISEVHGSTVERVVGAMPDEDEIFDLSELFKVFGDSTRMTQSAISHQLKLLKQAKLVKFSRAGKMVIYELADEHVRTIIAVGREHIEEL